MNDRRATRTVLICLRTDKEPVLQSVIDRCAYCDSPVWRALSSVITDIVICNDCFLEVHEPVLSWKRDA